MIFTILSILWIAWNPLWARLCRQRLHRQMAETRQAGKNDVDMLVIYGRGLLLVGFQSVLDIRCRH